MPKIQKEYPEGILWVTSDCPLCNSDNISKFERATFLSGWDICMAICRGCKHKYIIKNQSNAFGFINQPLLAF